MRYQKSKGAVAIGVIVILTGLFSYCRSGESGVYRSSDFHRDRGSDYGSDPGDYGNFREDPNARDRRSNRHVSLHAPTSAERDSRRRVSLH
jgi:hypothetical protein